MGDALRELAGRQQEPHRSGQAYPPERATPADLIRSVLERLDGMSLLLRAGESPQDEINRSQVELRAALERLPDHKALGHTRTP